GMRAVRDGADARTQLELALVKAATPEADAGTRALMARIERLEQALAGGARPAPVPKPAPAPPASAERPSGRISPTSSYSGASEPAAPPPSEAPLPRVAPAAGALGPRNEGSGERPVTGPAESAPGSPAPPTPVATIDREADLEGIIAVWPAVLDALRGDNMVLATALSHGRPVALDGKDLVVAFNEADKFKRRKAESQSQAVGSAVREISGAALRLHFEERDLPANTEEPQTQPTGDDLIARLVSEFDAEEILPEPDQPEEPRA
ncbi:MAG: hypothetical protein WKF96_08710, partial [Solirubrobacteraceae bacterium]